MDKGHIVGDEFDGELDAKRRRFEELLGNANGYAPVLTLYMESPNLDIQRTEIVLGVKAMFYSSLLDFLPVLGTFLAFCCTYPCISLHIFPSPLLTLLCDLHFA